MFVYIRHLKPGNIFYAEDDVDNKPLFSFIISNERVEKDGYEFFIVKSFFKNKLIVHRYLGKQLYFAKDKII